jgi:hypothetical protein
MTVPVDAIIRASARFRDNQGSDCVNVYTFQMDCTDPQDEIDVFNSVDAYLTTVYDEFDQSMDDDAEPYDLKVDVIEFQGGDWVVTQNVGFGSWGSGITPTGVSDPLPPGSAVLGKLYTGLGKHTGKKFFGVLTESILDTDGNATDAQVTNVLAGLVKLVTPYVITAGNRIVSVVLDQATGVARQVLEAAVSDVIAYQRRRRPGTGN